MDRRSPDLPLRPQDDHVLTAPATNSIIKIEMTRPKEDPRSRSRIVPVDAEPIDRDAVPLLQVALGMLHKAVLVFHARKGSYVPDRAIAMLERKLKRAGLKVPDVHLVADRSLEAMRLGTDRRELPVVIPGAHVSISDDIMSVDSLGMFRISRPFDGEGLAIVEVSLRLYAVPPPSVSVILTLRRASDFTRDASLAGLVKSPPDAVG